MTVRLDVTCLLEQKLSLYPSMLYLLTTVVNRHEEFRTALDSNGDVGIYDYLVPCYTVFHKETEAFSNIWTAYFDDYAAFVAEYKLDMKEYGSIERMIAKPDVPKNIFPVSMVPWVSFDGLNLNLQKGYEYLSPIFTMGKIETSNGRSLLPLSVQVHHAVCDGFHLSRFVNELQELVDNFICLEA